MRRASIVLAFAPLVACGPDTVSFGEEGMDEGFADGRTLVQIFDPKSPPRVDLILVIDDSPSMRPFTKPWAANASAFANVIEKIDADARIAITTTSVPGPTCAGLRALGGEPIVESCRAHLGDFVGADEHGEHGGGVEDLRSVCEQACSLDTIPRVPSLGADEHALDAVALRPWIEAPHNPFRGNLDGVELAEALTCAGLVGFAGCSFESPIEAAARMLEHMADPAHPMFEFRRPDAALMILTIGDEDDCSHPDSSATIFDPSGERTFWSNPDAAAPTSAVCINAGLDCDTRGCELSDHALDGTPTDDPASAVLTPLTRLHDALAANGEFDNPPWVPVVSSVGGYTYQGSVHYTPPGEELSDEQQTYVDGFGVLPGCAAAAPDPEPNLQAAPGGRLAEVVTPKFTYSICDANWSPALEIFATRIKPQAPPTCMEFACVADLDPSTELLEPDCVVEEVDYRGQRSPLPICVRDQSGWVIDPERHDYVVPVDVDACWAWLTDTEQQTSDVADNLSDTCVHDERPGEIKLARRSYFAYDSHYELRCRPC